LFSGGIAIVQNPDEVQYPDMPKSMLKYVAVDPRARLADISDLLARLPGSTGGDKAVLAWDGRTNPTGQGGSGYVQ